MCFLSDPIRFSLAWQISDSSFLVTPRRQEKIVFTELGRTNTNEYSDGSSGHIRDQGFLNQAPSAIAFYHHPPSSFSIFAQKAAVPSTLHLQTCCFKDSSSANFCSRLLHPPFLQPPLTTGRVKGSILERQCSIFRGQHS